MYLILSAIWQFYKKYKKIIKTITCTSIFVCGYIFSLIFIQPNTQSILVKIKSIKWFGLVFNLEDLITQKFISAITPLVFLLTSALIAYYKYPDSVNTINAVIDKLSFIAKLPSKIFLFMWVFCLGIVTFAMKTNEYNAGLGIFLYSSFLFGMPCLLYANISRFKIEKQSILDKSIIPLVYIFSTACIALLIYPLYSSVTSFLDIVNYIRK